MIPKSWYRFSEKIMLRSTSRFPETGGGEFLQRRGDAGQRHLLRLVADRDRQRPLAVEHRHELGAENAQRLRVDVGLVAERRLVGHVVHAHVAAHAVLASAVG